MLSSTETPTTEETMKIEGFIREFVKPDLAHAFRNALNAGTVTEMNESHMQRVLSVVRKQKRAAAKAALATKNGAPPTSTALPVLKPSRGRPLSALAA